MIKKTITKLVGLKKDQFDEFVKSGQIKLQPARLIPALKTGDEMALTSIFLSSLKLVKEYRDGFFKELGLARNGRVYYYTEASFPDLSKSRIDGLIIVVVKEKIADAAFLEMKSGKNNLELEQIERYIEISKKLKVDKLITISNEFVAEKSQSPLNIKVPKKINLLHFSWTYLLTKGQLLLFKNEQNIQDKDQVEIMKEVLHYFENPISGIRGFQQMKPGWNELSGNVHAHKPLKLTDSYIADAVLSWHEEEKDMSLLLSRKLGVLVEPISKSKNRLKDDIRSIVKENFIQGRISIKDAVSDIFIRADFERRVISMSIEIAPPLNRGNSSRVTWISKQLLNCSTKSEVLFNRHKNDLWLESNIKFANENIKIKVSDISNLPDLVKDKKDIQAFHLSINKSLGAKFAHPKKVIELMESLILEFHEGLVQHMLNWKKPAPKVVEIERQEWENPTPKIVIGNKEIEIKIIDEENIADIEDVSKKNE